MFPPLSQLVSFIRLKPPRFKFEEPFFRLSNAMLKLSTTRSVPFSAFFPSLPHILFITFEDQKNDFLFEYYKSNKTSDNWSHQEKKLCKMLRPSLIKERIFFKNHFVLRIFSWKFQNKLFDNSKEKRWQKSMNLCQRVAFLIWCFQLWDFLLMGSNDWKH